MNSKQALEIIQAAVEPENAGKISVKGYAAIFQALQVLEELVKATEEKKDDKEQEKV